MIVVSNKYAREHEKHKTRNVIFGIIFGASFVVGIPLTFVIGPFAAIIIVVGAMIGGIGLATTGAAQAKNITEFKKEILAPRMMDFFSDFEYKPTESFLTSTVRELRLFNTGDSIYTSELYQGRYRGCSFAMSNVKCTETSRDSDGDTHTRTVFLGRLIIIGASVIDEGEVKIRPKGYLPFFYRKGKSLEYDHQVCRNFDIRGSELVELPRYFLDHVNNFGSMFYKHKFYYKVTHDRIYIGIDNIGQLYDVGDCKDTSIENIDRIIKKDSVFFTNLISLILDAKNKEL